MDGKKAYKHIMKTLPGFIDRSFTASGMTLSDINYVIPHQASYSGIRLVKKKLSVPDDKYIVTIQNHGNTIAASIPFALYEAVKKGTIKRGDRVMFLGFSAGLSLGTIIFDY